MAMNVLVVGGHGQIAMRLLRLLAERGDRARGMIRKPDQAADLEEIGAEPVVRDIEEADDISAEVEGSDAVVFAAGAGPGSGPARKGTVDLGGAVKLIDACKATGVERYLMVSAMGVERPDSWQQNMKPYYEAKRDADDALRESGLAYTIARHQLRSLDTLEKLLLQVTRKNDTKGYERFRDLFEAIVAYNE